MVRGTLKILQHLQSVNSFFLENLKLLLLSCQTEQNDACGQEPFEIIIEKHLLVAFFAKKTSLDM